MDRIEFEMKPSQNDLRRLSIKILQMSPTFRVYFVFCVGTCFLFVLFMKLQPSHQILYSALAFFSFLCIACPIAYVLGQARFAYNSYWKQNKQVFFLDSSGWGSRSDTSEIFVKWESFDYLKETDRYILLKSGRNTRDRFVIYKTALPKETVSLIKKMLADAPITNKQLL